MTGDGLVLFCEMLRNDEDRHLGDHSPKGPQRELAVAFSLVLHKIRFLSPADSQTQSMGLSGLGPGICHFSKCLCSLSGTPNCSNCLIFFRKLC